MTESLKTCRACSGSKPVHLFNLDRRTPDGHSPICRSCARAQGAAYRARNIASVRRRERVNAETYRLTHPERRKAIVRESSRRRRAVNPFVHRLAAQHRRDLPLTNSQLPCTWHELLAYWDERGLHACIYCGAPFAEIDHVEPIALGGKTTLQNLVPSCEFCNRSKSSKLLVDWLPDHLEAVALRSEIR